MKTALDYEKPEFEVKVLYKAYKFVTVKADSREEAHKKAYNQFMDSPEKDTLRESSIEDSFIETAIEGEEGSDMFHD
tara:strand:- start:4382 stop:4612 length:231 start_codon:yes stop_codon:yes gene_type:complete